LPRDAPAVANDEGAAEDGDEDLAESVQDRPDYEERQEQSKQRVGNGDVGRWVPSRVVPIARRSRTLIVSNPRTTCLRGGSAALKRRRAACDNDRRRSGVSEQKGTA
jgi:hypothetical protein